MSEILATSPQLPEEKATVEERLADIIETAEVRIDEYRLSDSDKAKVVHALRAVVAGRSILEECSHDFNRCPKCDYQDDNAIKDSDLFILMNGNLNPVK